MRVLLIDKEKISKMTLPNEVSGIYILNYKSNDLNVTKDLIIEAINNSWMIKSNNNICVFVNNQIVDEIKLEEYMHVKVKILGQEENLDLYCLPTFEKNVSILGVNATEISIGTTNQCGIIFNNIQEQYIFSKISQQNGMWVISPSDQGINVPIYLNDKILDKPHAIQAGDIIFIYGLKIIWMGTHMHVTNLPGKISINQLILPAYTDTYYDNTKYDEVNEEQQNLELYKPEEYFFHRPILKEFVEEEEIVIDPPPESQEMKDDNFLATFGASFTMISSAFVSGLNLINNINNGGNTISIVTSGIMCASMLIGSILIPKVVHMMEKHQSKKREEYRIDKYVSYLKDVYAKIDVIMTKQTQALNSLNKSINECINFCVTKSAMLWNREIKDEDFLICRLGIGNMPAKIKIQAPEQHFTLDEDKLLNIIDEIVNSSKILNNIPVTFDFKQNRVSAIINKVSYGEAFINSVIIQLATLHSCQDLKLVFFINPEEPNCNFEYAKYLPHIFSDDKQTRYYANNYDEMKIISTQLENILKERKESNKSENDNSADIIDDSKKYKSFDTYYVIVTNDIIMSNDLPIFSELLNANENYGFSVIYLTETMNKLPKRCNAFIPLSEDKGSIMVKDINSQITFAPEVCPNINLKDLCSVLMNIPVLSTDAQSSLPTSITFLDIFKASKIEQLNITNRWKVNDPTISLGATIGVHTSGEPFILDLHEKHHGPHGLIAGSTGSGKSEFIITYILSLAINYHPDEVQFVLIDYKGGGLAGAFENKEKGVAIPHLAGTITNLDTAEMNRSLVSINSELKRREQMFMDARDVTGESTLDIYKYQKYYREGIVKEPMSHLFIISDEFAELKSQQPEFMDELVSTARVGRSLGVHLILATQKPSGVVNDQIWANSKFKICLKVQTAGDSNEMLKRPDAASLKNAGRFYLQVGYDEYFDIGQSGWAGAKYIPTDRTIKKVDDSINFINNVGSVTKSINELIKKEVVASQGDQLTNIVKYLEDWGISKNYKPKKLWLDPIPENIYLNQLTEKYNYVAEPYHINPIIGEYDNPKKQSQGLLTLDINKGNTYIFGKNGSGKEELLTTLIYSCCTNHSPEELNMYIVDMGAGTLRQFLRYPQVGDVCTLDDGDKIIDLMSIIEKEINKRKEITVDFGGNFNTYNEMNPNNKLPLKVVIINNLDIFTENFSKISELIIPLYRDGAKYGVVFIVTCIGVNTLRSKVKEYFTNHISLVVSNKDDYYSLFNNYPRKLEPASHKGRGLVEMNKDVLEFQSAQIVDKKELNIKLKETANILEQKYQNNALVAIPSIPKIVNVNNFLDEIKTLEKIPLGYNTDGKEKYYYDFKNKKVNLIASNNFDNHLPFLNALVTELRCLQGDEYDIKIVDFSGYFDILTIGLTCYQSNFNDTFGRLIEESQNLKKHTLYIFTGIGKLNSLVDPHNLPFVNQFFINTLNNKLLNFIFIDTYEQLNILKLEEWYTKIVNNENGIWLGPDVGSQTIIKFNNLSSEDRMVNNPEYAFAAENGKRNLIKIITMKDEDNEEE